MLDIVNERSLTNDVTYCTRLVCDGSAEGGERVLLALAGPGDLAAHAEQAQLVAAAREHAARAATVPP